MFQSISEQVRTYKFVQKEHCREEKAEYVDEFQRNISKKEIRSLDKCHKQVQQLQILQGMGTQEK